MLPWQTLLADGKLYFGAQSGSQISSKQCSRHTVECVDLAWLETTLPFLLAPVLISTESQAHKNEGHYSRQTYSLMSELRLESCVPDPIPLMTFLSLKYHKAQWMIPSPAPHPQICSHHAPTQHPSIKSSLNILHFPQTEPNWVPSFITSPSPFSSFAFILQRLGQAFHLLWTSH
jgi:hypothetical protein